MPAVLQPYHGKVVRFIKNVWVVPGGNSSRGACSCSRRSVFCFYLSTVFPSTRSEMRLRQKVGNFLTYTLTFSWEMIGSGPEKPTLFRLADKHRSYSGRDGNSPKSPVQGQTLYCPWSTQSNLQYVWQLMKRKQRRKWGRIRRCGFTPKLTLILVRATLENNNNMHRNNKEINKFWLPWWHGAIFLLLIDRESSGKSAAWRHTRADEVKSLRGWIYQWCHVFRGGAVQFSNAFSKHF